MTHQNVASIQTASPITEPSHIHIERPSRRQPQTQADLSAVLENTRGGDLSAFDPIDIELALRSGPGITPLVEPATCCA